MRVTVTDKFLWDIYSVLEKAGTVADFALSKSRRLRVISTKGNPIVQKYIESKNRKKFSQLIYHLKKNNYIRTKSLNGNQAVILTKKGIEKALQAKFKLETNNFPKRKDGKWIMITFDVPEKWRKSRNLLRSVLHNLGYKIFQQSVWVTPYDVSSKTEELLQQYSLEQFVKIFLIEEIS